MNESILKFLVYENKHFVVINKPPGLLVHPVKKEDLSVFGYIHPGEDFVLSKKKKYGIVHRLDQYTSGCMILSKDNFTTQYLSNLFLKKKISKYYIAVTPISGSNNAIINKVLLNLDLLEYKNLNDRVNDLCTVRGISGYCKEFEFIFNNININDYFYPLNGGVFLKNNWISISGWISRYARKMFRFDIKYSNNSKSCLTFLRPLYRIENKYVLWLVKLYTGRTHQIRSVFKYLNLPILGDFLYSNKISKRLCKELNLNRYLLHSCYLSFKFPKIDKLIPVEDKYWSIKLNSDILFFEFSSQTDLNVL